MKTTGLCKFSRCFIRKRAIADTPEERVRQVLLQKMVAELGFPKGLLSVERAIPHQRRTDIICYTQEMIPLLLIECKAGPIGEAAIRQVLGYNETMGAPFVALSNGKETMTLWFEGAKRTSVPFLPTYEELSNAARL